MILDKNGVVVLMALSKELNGTGYKVIDKSDVLSNNPDTIGKEMLNIALLELLNNGYIKVKYNDADEVCLSITELAWLRIKELETVELKKLTKSAVIKTTAQGETVITSIDEESAFEEEPEEVLLPTVMPAETPITKTRKQPGRFATFVYGIFGGVLGSGIVAAVYFLVTTFGI